MGAFGKFLLFVFVALYVVSPVDVCPGPVDDLLLLVFTVGGSILKNRLEGG